MPYSSVDELPPAVKNKIKSSKKRRQWMHVWNSEYNSHHDESRAFAAAWAVVQKGFNPMSNFNFFLPISKVEKQDDGTCIVSGYASSQTRDLDGEIVSIDAIKKAWPGYWEYRNIREMHQAKAVGVGKEAHIDEVGPFLRAKIVDPVAVQKCVEEVYKGFSIGGRKLAKSGDVITELELIEVSLVDRPANPDCRISISKRAKDAKDGAYLIKTAKTKRELKDKAISKMAEVVDLLAKSPGNPPAAHDGFSLPAKKSGHRHEIECETGPPIEKESVRDLDVENELEGKCKEHGVVDCPECIDKREFSQEERDSAAESGAALPDGSFPIKNKSDLMNARHAIGRAKDKAAARAHIKSRARALGVKLPDNWSKKSALKLIKKFESRNLDKSILSSSPALPPFLALENAGSIEGLEKTVAPWVNFQKLDLPSPQLRKGGKKTNEIIDLIASTDDVGLTERLQEYEIMEKNTTAAEISSLDDSILDLLKRAAAPSRVKRMEMCKGNLQKARKARKAAATAMREVHEMHKSAYLSKLAKKAKKDNDADDKEFDHQGAMEKIQKAYSSLEAMKTFIKAADLQIEKSLGMGAAVGDSSGKVKDDVSGHFQNISPGQMSDLKSSGAMISKELHEMAVENAMLKGQLATLEKLPSTGRKPMAFDLAKVGDSQSKGDKDKSAALFDGVNPMDLNSTDENVHTAATAKVIGNMVTSGHFAKSVMDPEFRGGAGNGKRKAAA